MASIRKGQIPIPCQLCENEFKIKWKCLQCKLMMCQRCKDKVHSKFPSASDHTIIDIKDSKTQEEELEPKLDFSTLKCPVHKGQNCCLFCKTCTDVVCPTCIAKTHQSHSLVEMGEGYEIQIENAKYFKRNIDLRKQYLSTGAKNLNKIKMAEQSNYNKAKQDICDQEEAIVKAAKKQKDELLDELDQKWNDLKKSINKEGDYVNSKQKQLTEQIDKVRDILQSKDVQKVFSSSRDLFSSKDEKIEVKKSFDHIPKFVRGELDGISSLFGSLHEDTISQELEVKVLDHYRTNLDHIMSMSVCPDNTIYICDIYDVIQRINPENHSTKIISKIKVNHRDMALLPSGDLLITTEDSHLNLVPHGRSQIKQTHNITPGMKTLSVHVSPSNNIIVTASSNINLYTNDGSSQVIVMDQAGKTLKVHEYDRNRKPLFTRPDRVCSNSINNIGVVDRISHHKGRIVVLDKDGNVNNIYTGHPDVNNKDNLYHPYDIVATYSDNFVICDAHTGTLHILNDNGHVVTYYNIKELIDGYPWTLAISKTNNLYIGTNEGMIYKTDMSGC